MNVKTIIAASAIAILGTSAFASETNGFATPSTLSRAAVVAELQRAQNAGEIAPSSEVYADVDSAIVAAQRTTLTRAAVRQDLAQAGDQFSSNEAYGTVQPGLSLRTRSEVRAEAFAAQNGAE